MRKLVTAPAKWLFHRLGYELARLPGELSFPPDFEEWHKEIFRRVEDYTMTSPERVHALCSAVRYLVEAEVPGDIVECGVWRGGSMMAVALTFLRLGSQRYSLRLYDTFEGMSEPTERDVAYTGVAAQESLERASKDEWVWARSPRDEVERAMHSTGYERTKIHLIQGRIEDTVPAQAPEQIALLRLDTDWYESTRHELVHLFPRLSRGGVIIIDDYGHWKGARQATDEYLRESGVKLLLNRIDYTGRIGIKL